MPLGNDSGLARAEVHEVPLDSLVADSQGAIGYMLQRLIREELSQKQLDLPVATVITEVEVDPNDPAFANPDKPVGLFYDETTAHRLMTERGWPMREDAGRGWRRVRGLHHGEHDVRVVGFLRTCGC